MKRTVKINREIKSNQVRIIEEGKAPRILGTPYAIKEAEQRGEDLILISAKADPPVCTIMEYGKWQYKEKKKAKERKKNQVVVEVKELRFQPQCDEHDYQVKLKQAKEFLGKGNRLKVSVFFKGRSIMYKDQGKTLLERFLEDLKEEGILQGTLGQMEGRRMVIGVIPKKKG